MKKDPEFLQIWEETRKWSLDDFDEIYKWLDIRFDHFFYESEFEEEGKQMVLECENLGILKRSEGALGIKLKEEPILFKILS